MVFTIQLEAVAGAAAILILLLSWLARPCVSRSSGQPAAPPSALDEPVASGDELDAGVSARRGGDARRRPLLRRARAVGAELAIDRGGVLPGLLRLHVEQRHGPGKAPPVNAASRAESTFLPSCDRVTVLTWICGTLSRPDRVVGDADDARRVFFYRDWGRPVGVVGASGAVSSVIKVVAHMSAVGGLGSRPRVVTAFPCRAGPHRRDVALLDDT